MADQVPEVIIPAVCIEENITPVPNVLLERTVVPFILKVLPEAKLKLQELSLQVLGLQLLSLHCMVALD